MATGGRQRRPLHIEASLRSQKFMNKIAL